MIQFFKFDKLCKLLIKQNIQKIGWIKNGINNNKVSVIWPTRWLHNNNNNNKIWWICHWMIEKFFHNTKIQSTCKDHMKILFEEWQRKYF